MGNVRNGSWGRRPRPRRLAFAATAVLGGCAVLTGCAPTLAPEALTTSELRRATTAGEALVLARFHRADNGAAIYVGGAAASVPAFVTRMEDGRQTRFRGTTPSAAAWAQGWVAQPLPAGSYYLTVGVGSAPEEGRAFTFDVPPGGGVTYVGSFPFDCPYAVDQPCQRLASPVSEPPDARPAMPETGGPMRVSLATRYNPRLASQGWPPAARVTVAADPGAVQMAVNWEDFVSRSGSRGTFRVAGGMADIGFIALQGREVGVIIAAPFFAGALATVAVGGLVSGAESIHRSMVERQWRPCLEALGSPMSAGAIQARLPPPLADEPAPDRSHSRAVPTAEWQVQVTRAVLRRCTEAGSYGLEVAQRWRTAGHEARITRAVEGAPDQPGLRFNAPPAWESVLPGTAPCRPLADYCRPESSGLLASDLADAIAAARDLIGRQARGP